MRPSPSIAAARSRFREAGTSIAGSADLNSYFPVSVGNVANPATTGTSASVSTFQAGGSDASGVTEITSTAGGAAVKRATNLAVGLAVLRDSESPTSTLYESLDSGKPSYKNSRGTVTALY